jgi:hypothetical protein
MNHHYDNNSAFNAANRYVLLLFSGTMFLIEYLETIIVVKHRGCNLKTQPVL